MSHETTNSFTTAPLGVTYLRTALPIIFMMAMNGLLTVADALFLGLYVGAAALGAVTLMFPLFMIIVALSTLVASGMSSLLARFLGASDHENAQRVFATAHAVSLTLGAILIGLFTLFGPRAALLAAAGSVELADMGALYLRITVYFSPLLFILSVHSDALRNEGHVGFMAAMGLLVSLSNIGFNFVLIALLDFGVAGSAYGTAAAQAMALVIILIYRGSGATVLTISALRRYAGWAFWRRILALGAPQSLNFLGIALGSAASILALQWVGTPRYEETVTAYGIFTRVMTFAFLPLLGLSFAMQTITGNNYGAQLWARSDSSLRIAIMFALLYCALVEVIMLVFARQIGAAFLDDSGVIAEVARIVPIMVCMFFLAGPLMMLSSYFQAIGDASKAALLGLSKPYLFAIPLTVLLPLRLGEVGIWWAGPVAELCLLVLAIALLLRAARRSGLDWGIFHPTSKGAQPD